MGQSVRAFFKFFSLRSAVLSPSHQGARDDEGDTLAIERFRQPRARRSVGVLADPLLMLVSHALRISEVCELQAVETGGETNRSDLVSHGQYARCYGRAATNCLRRYGARPRPYNRGPRLEGPRAPVPLRPIVGHLIIGVPPMGPLTG